MELQIIYLKEVMEALDEHANTIFEVLKPFPNMTCVSGFDRLSLELIFLGDEYKSSSLVIALIF